jgi:glycosyltransferase involved in cell wall biosynthesis
MKISVLICTRNRPQDVAVCLPTVLACLRDDWDVLVVDQSNNDETGAVVRSLAAHCPTLRYLPTSTVGKSLALDIAIRQAEGEILAFTDDDCEAPPEWLDMILTEFERSPESDILFGPVLPSPAIADIPSICVPSWSFDEARDLLPGEVCGMGANMALRRSVLSRLPEGSFFDPVLGPGAAFPAGEEGDFVYRLRRMGACAALRPSLRLYHRAYRTMDRWQEVLQSYGVGDAAFYAKHARCGDGWALRTCVSRFGGSAIRAFAKSLLGRKPNSDLSYLRGFWKGLRQSASLPINRLTRFYEPAKAQP